MKTNKLRKGSTMTAFNRDVRAGRHGNLSAIGAWRRKSWPRMDYAEKSKLSSYILVAYKGEKSAEKAAAYFGVSVRTALAALRMLVREGEVRMGEKATVVRYAIGSNLGDGGKNCGPRNGPYYVNDLLEQRPADTDPKKGWYRKIKTVQAAVDKLNAADKGGPYLKLPNGYVRVAL